jgi:hypothetical protein
MSRQSAMFIESEGLATEINTWVDSPRIATFQGTGWEKERFLLSATSSPSP